MEALLVDSPELEEQRAQAAGFIQGNLQLVRDLIEDGAFEEVSEEALEGIESFEIFDHQLDALGALWTAREGGADKALLHMATGLGKTSVGVLDVIKFYEDFRAEQDRAPRVLFACHKKEILEQAAERFGTFIPDLSQGFYADVMKDRDGDITFATLQALYNSLDDFDPKEYDYVIYDEAHHSKADTFEQVVDHFDPAFQLALTATPDRLDQRDIRELFGEPVYSKNLAEALAEGLLVEPDYHIVFDDAVKEALDTDFSPTSVKELRKLLDVWPRNEQIAENIKAEMEKLGLELGKAKTIVFCQDIAHSEDMAWLLEGEAYHSELPKAKRKEILQRFRDGDLQTICVRDMFNEGIDIPDAELLVFLRSTVSETIFEQQLGRGLRKHEGKDRVTVLDFAANIERILMIRELAKSIGSHAPKSAERSLYNLEDDAEEDAELAELFKVRNFDFNKLSIDLLEKYDALNFDFAPKEYLSALTLSEEIGIAPQTLMKYVKEYDVAISRHKFGKGKVGVSFSPEAQSEIKNILEDVMPPAPEGHVSVWSFSEENEESLGSIKLMIAENDIEVGSHKFNYGVAASLDPEAQLKLKEIMSTRPEKKDPKDYMSVNSFVKRTPDISRERLLKLAAENDIKIEIHTFKGRRAMSLSPEAQAQLRELFPFELKGAPDDFMSLHQLAVKENVSDAFLLREAESHGVEITRHRFQGRPGRSFSPEGQAQIGRILSRIQSAPDDHVSLNAFAKIKEVSRPFLEKIIEDNNLETAIHKFKTNIGVSLSPETQQQLSSIIESRAPKASKGFLSVSAFAKRERAAVSTITRLALENEIEITVHRHGSNTVEDLSPEAQSLLRDHLVAPAPDGHTSVSAFADESGIPYDRLRQQINDYGIKTGYHRFGPARGLSLSPEAREQLREINSNLIKSAPDGHVSVAKFARKKRLARETLVKIIDENEIETAIHRFGAATGSSLSPEAQEQLTRIIESD